MPNMDVSSCPSGVGRNAVTCPPAPDGLASGIGDEHGLLREKILALREANLLLRVENSDLKAGSSSLAEEKQGRVAAAQSLWENHQAMERRDVNLELSHLALAEQMSEYQRSLGWTMLHKASEARRRLFREGRLSGRCWNAFSRFVRVAVTAGPAEATKKAVKKVVRKLAGPRAALVAPAIAQTHQDCHQTEYRALFAELPWRYLGEISGQAARRAGHYQVLLISHSATRTGAPLCFLRLAEELSRFSGVECWIFLLNGGELADEFARVAPTLDVPALAAHGISYPDIPAKLARRFRDYSSRGIAICNTVVLSNFHAAFAEQQVPVLSWVHELPVSIDHFGGKRVMDLISAASRRVIVPADAVRQAMIERYAVDPDQITTVYYGLEARTRDLEQKRQTFRRQVRRELGIPEDALIVLGCGTIELRKGADLFAQLCRRVLTEASAGEPAANAWFIWVGQREYTFFQDWLIHDGEHGVAKGRLIFAGPRDDTVPYFMAADLFALTSREDPCPFANLEAMESGLPVVAFEESGGAPEVLQDAGICVPHLDVSAMAAAARELLNHPTRRSQMGRRGQEIIRSTFTWPRFMGQFERILREEYGYHAEVPLRISAIVPNYRHAPYLEQRLQSIFAQTRLPDEIIFLDDASPDDSVEVARRMAELSPVPMRIVVNPENNGSTFLQWLKGLDLATGDLVWFAESDDCCHPEFLERLVPEFYDPEVSLAYCQSALIGTEGQRLADTFLAHTDDISTTRWRSRYKATAAAEAELALCQKNTIPNASAVLFRRPDRLDFADELAHYRFAGDWLFYALLSRAGKIVYLPDVLNLYRRHEQTVSHHAVRGDTYVVETLSVKARMFETYPVSRNAIAGSLARSVLEYGWLTQQFQLQRPCLTANPIAALPLERIRAALQHRRGTPARLRVLLVLSDMEASVRTLSMIHLAGALATDHEVFLCNARPSKCDAGMSALVDSRVIFIEGNPGPTLWSAGTEDLTELSSPSSNHRLRLLKELVAYYRIDVIHSHHPAAARLVLAIKEGMEIPWFTHAECERTGLAPVGANPDSVSGWHRAIRSATGIFFDPEADPSETVRLAGADAPRWIGLRPGLDPECLSRPRQQLIRNGDVEMLFFISVSDRTGESEWQKAIVATELLNELPEEERGHRRARLVIASDESANPIRADMLPSGEAVVLRDRRADLVAPIAECDIFLSLHDEPSAEARFEVAAALGFGVPIITVASGPFSTAIAHESGDAGLCIPWDREAISMVRPLFDAMLRYLKERGLATAHRAQARRIFGARFHSSKAAAICSRSYVEACRSTRPDRGSTRELQAESDSWTTRQSA